MPRKPIKSQLVKIREEYEKAHGITDAVTSTGGNGGAGGAGNGVEIAVERAQGAERDARDTYSGYKGITQGTEHGQGNNRELYRGHGLTGEPDEYADRGDDSPVQEDESGLGRRAAQQVIVQNVPVKKGRPRRKLIPPVLVHKGTEEKSKEVEKLARPRPLVMDEKEVSTSKEKLTQAFIGFFKAADEMMRVTLATHPHVEVWSTIDDSDIAILVSSVLEHGQKSVVIAEGVRRAIFLWEQYKIGAILLPRFVESWQLYMKYGFDVPVARTRKRIVDATKQRPPEREPTTAHQAQAE